ncbi:thioredoxin family protein [bacterium]|nr:thioredoxin family protein [bacterium]RQV94307.1 MAG: DUF255 domain-containing protein [bacterium]
MKKLALWLVFKLFGIGILWSQGVDPVELSMEVVPKTVEINGKGVVEIICAIASHYHISDTTYGLFKVIPQTSEGIRFSPVEYPVGEKGDLGNYYRDSVTVRMPFVVNRETSEGNRIIEVDVTYQACSEDGEICYLPKTQRLMAELTVLAFAPEDQGGFTEETGMVNSLSRALEKGSIIAFLLVFIGGILTSLTPCVYPMIPITIAVIGAQAGGGKLRGFVLSLFYVLGIAATFSVLGILAAQTGTLFGSYTQHPVVIIMIASIFFLMGLSLLGVFVLQMPPTIASKLKGNRKGFLGAWVTGLLAGFIVSPCISPLLIVILTWVAKSGSVLLGFGLLFSFALGLGVLFVLIGTFSGVIKNFPRSGSWMAVIERGFGILLVTLSLVYLEPLLPVLVYHGLWALLLVILGTFIGAFSQLEGEADWKKKMGKALGILLIIAGGSLVFSLFFRFFNPGIFSSEHIVRSIEEEPFWISSDEAGFQQARLEGKVVVMDFYADWCAACRELDEKTWTDERVLFELSKFVPIKLDLTRNDELTASYQDRYQIIGLPTVIFFSPSEEELGRFGGFKSPEEILPDLLKYQNAS